MKDRVGQDIAIDDYVVVYHSDDSNPEIRQVTSFTPKKVKSKSVGGQDKSEVLRFPDDLIRIDKDLAEAKFASKHYDHFGQEFAVGDVAVASNGVYIELVIYKIIEIRPDNVRVTCLTNSRAGMSWTMFSQNLIKVDPQLVTFMVLKEKN